MKRKILSVILIVLLGIGLVLLTGCAADNGESSADGRKIKNFYELKYVEPKGYTSESDFVENRDVTKYYFYGEYEGSINMTCKKGKDYSEVEDLYYHEHTEEQINGTTWRLMNDDSLGTKSRFYYTVHNNDFYLIELNGIDKYQNEMDEFIKNVSFN